MTKIICGKKYDTETAKLIGDIYGDTYDERDFRYWTNQIYRKKTGEYFLYEEGNENTRYGGTRRITPLTLDEAREWIAVNLDGDVYENLFGPVEE